MLNQYGPVTDGAACGDLYRLLDGVSLGVLLLDAGRCVTYANARATRQLRQHRIVLTPQGTLLADDVDTEQRLQALLDGALRTCRSGGAMVGSMDVHHRGVPTLGLPASAEGNALVLSFVALPASERLRSLSGAGIIGMDAAIFISECGMFHRVPGAALADLYGLTPREIRICQGFINSASLEALAPEVGLQLGSLRTKMKAIYQKTGRHSQAALMRLLMEMKINI